MHKIIFKNKSNRKKKFTIYHFLVKSKVKPYERIVSWLQQVWIFTNKNSNSNEELLFLRKTDETIWKPSLSTNPPISNQFFHDPPLCPNFNNKIPPIVFFFGGGGISKNTPKSIYWDPLFLLPILILCFSFLTL